MNLKHLHKDTPFADIAAVLSDHGGVIVDDVLDRKFIDRILSELSPAIERTQTSQNAFSGVRTTRTGALVARSQAACETVLHPVVHETAKVFLSPWCDRIQLHLTQIIRILPGQPSLPLHRDRLIWGRHLPHTLEPQLNAMWALTDFTEENGATRIVPGSQAWPPERKAKEGEIVSAEMRAGSVLFFTGTVLHGGGENRSTQERVGLNIDYSLAWLRQEENQYLSCPPEAARRLPPVLQDLLGYTMGGFGLGYFSFPDEPGVNAPERAVGREATVPTTPYELQ